MTEPIAAPLVFALSPCRRTVASMPHLQLGSAWLGRFPNGELRARVETPVDGRDCAIVGSIAPPDTRILQLTLLAHALRRTGARSITATLPYLAYARQDSAGPGAGLGLAWVGELLRASGVDRVVTVDAHSPAAEGLLGMPCASLDPSPVFAAALPRDWVGEEVTFVAPDEGAIDRCRRLADAVANPRPIAVLSKRRSATGVVHLDLAGALSRRALIVDDILDTGATLLSCCRWLVDRGVEEIAVAVTHGVFTGAEWRRLWSAGMSRLWVTDTIAGARFRAAGAEFVSVTPLLAPLLQRSAEADAGGPGPDGRSAAMERTGR